MVSGTLKICICGMSMGTRIDAGEDCVDKTGICCQAAPGGSVFVPQQTVFERTRPLVEQAGCSLSRQTL